MRRAVLFILAAAVVSACGCTPRAENNQATSRLQESSITSPTSLNRHDTESAAYLRYDPF